MDKIVTEVITLVIHKHNLSLRDIYRRKRNKTVDICLGEIWYNLSTTYDYSINHICREFNTYKKRVNLGIDLYRRINNITEDTTKVKHYEYRAFIMKSAELLQTCYNVDLTDSISILEMVYQRGYKTGLQAGQRRSWKRLKFDQNSFPGYTYLPPSENNAPAGISGAIHPILNEGDHGEISAPKRVKTANSTG